MIHFRKRIFNENCFDDTNELSAYWMGFLMADGSNGYYPEYGSYKISIQLSKMDVDHLYKFVDFIGSKNVIVKTLFQGNGFNNKKHEMCRVVLNSKTFCEKLMCLGLTTKKTFNATVNDRYLW